VTERVWLLLAISYASAARFLRASPSPAQPTSDTTRGGWALIRSAPVLAGQIHLAMRDAIIAILNAAGLPAAPADDDMRALAIRVFERV
jgi:hypothetical protein